MKVLNIRIELENDVFESADGLDEVKRLLQDVGQRIPEDLSMTGGAYSFHDLNGNWCGEFGIGNYLNGEI